MGGAIDFSFWLNQTKFGVLFFHARCATKANVEKAF
jgi:hypothetical protein